MSRIDFQKIESKIQKQIDEAFKGNEIGETVRSVALEIAMVAIQEYHEELVKKVLGEDFR